PRLSPQARGHDLSACVRGGQLNASSSADSWQSSATAFPPPLWGREPYGTRLRHLRPAKSEMLQQRSSLRTNRTVPEHPTILMFDSGLGGLTVFREVKATRPDARLRYVADDAFFPYGAHGEAELVGRVVPLMGALIDQHQPALVVIACNTASTLVLPHLRERYEVPFVGTVPAIKPACVASQTKRVSVLGTEGTVSREYTRALIRDFGNGADVTLVGSAKLAAIAEAE